MLRLVFLVLLGLQDAAAVTHSLKYFFTGSSGIPNFPEFVVVGMVDDVQMIHYDSNTNMVVPKRDWMNKVTEDDPHYWQKNTENCRSLQQTFKANIEIAKQRFTQTGVTHSLKYVYTGSSGIPNLPVFVAVGLVDDVQVVHYDSKTKRAEPKQDWMNKVSVDDPQFWQRSNEIFAATQPSFKANIEALKQRFNQTGGVHIYQEMYGCEWDDEIEVVRGYRQIGYDGEDFIALDQNMESYIAPKPEAFITKQKLDKDKAFMAQIKNYHTQECPEWLQKYLNYGRSSLMRTERPSVSLLQKTSSSPVICHATGFYPNRAEMFWRKNGEETHEGVDKGEILPNNDGTFQMSVDLKLPSSEDWTKYECVFQLSGVNDDIITNLEKAGIRTNEDKPDLILPVIIGVLVAVIVFAVVGLILYKKNLPPFKKNDKRSPCRRSNFNEFSESRESDESKESSQKMLPEA